MKTTQDIKDPQVRLSIYKEALRLIKEGKQVFGLTSEEQGECYYGLCIVLPCIWLGVKNYMHDWIDNEGKRFYWWYTTNYFPEFDVYYHHKNNQMEYNTKNAWRVAVLTAIIAEMEQQS